MAYILHQSPAGHGHGTGAYEMLESSVACQPSRSPLPGSTSVRAAFVHVVGDLLQSVSVLVAATIIYFKVPRLDCPTATCGSSSPSPQQGGLCPQPHRDPAPCSPSARLQTPSAPSSSRSSSLAPPSQSSEMSSGSSWKVSSEWGCCESTGVCAGAPGALCATAHCPWGGSPPLSVAPPECPQSLLSTPAPR